jgi:hypothetical protein
MIHHVIKKQRDSKLFPMQNQQVPASTVQLVPYSGKGLKEVVRDARSQRESVALSAKKITTQMEYNDHKATLKFAPGQYVVHIYNRNPCQDLRDISYCLYIEPILHNIKQISSLGWPEACVMMPCVIPASHPKDEVYFFQESGIHRRPLSPEEFTKFIDDSIQDRFEEVVKTLTKHNITCVPPDREWKGVDTPKSDCEIRK